MTRFWVATKNKQRQKQMRGFFPFGFAQGRLTGEGNSRSPSGMTNKKNNGNDKNSRRAR
jgi:hypothetical protein